MLLEFRLAADAPPWHRVNHQLLLCDFERSLLFLNV